MYEKFIEVFSLYAGVGIFAMGILFFIFSFIQTEDKRILREGSFLYLILGILLYLHNYKIVMLELFKKLLTL